MATEVIMPKNGMAMEEGKLIRWLKEVGDTVEKDDALIEIETDKITMEEPAAASGILLAKWAEEGETIPVLQTIGWIGAKGEAIPEKPAAAQAGAPVPAAADEAPASSAGPVITSGGAGIPATPYAKKLAGENGVTLEDIKNSGKDGVIYGRDVTEYVKATPLARKMAGDMGINLADVNGSGFGGKVTRGDLAMAPPAVPAASGGRRVPMSGMRKAVARNMMAAHTNIPPVTNNITADVTEFLALRAEVNTGREAKFSINDFILLAVAKSLRKNPQLLVSIEGDELIYHDNVHLGMAVALDEGLIVPVIKDADKMGLGCLAETAKDLAARAKEGKLGMDEYSGSTFTVSNLGMFGIESFTPIINLPESAILGVCGIRDELALLEDGSVSSRKKIGLSLTFDHRAMDGVPPARFLQTLKQMLENPFEILV